MVAAFQAAGPNPIVNSRDAALVASAVFDAVNGIERRYEPIHVDMAAPGASPRAAVQAAYAILVRRFPAQTADLGAKLAASLAAIGDEGGGQSVAHGRGVGPVGRRLDLGLAEHRRVFDATPSVPRQS